jgi:hypothetical protein
MSENVAIGSRRGDRSFRRNLTDCLTQRKTGTEDKFGQIARTRETTTPILMAATCDHKPRLRVVHRGGKGTFRSKTTQELQNSRFLFSTRSSSHHLPLRRLFHLHPHPYVLYLPETFVKQVPVLRKRAILPRDSFGNFIMYIILFLKWARSQDLTRHLMS